MVRWKLKGCPRCSGDLNVIHDVLGYYEDCLQCGYHHYYKAGYVDILHNKVDEKGNDDDNPSDPSQIWRNEDTFKN